MSFAATDITPSPLEQLRRQAAKRADYIDLSSSNPTHHGFLFPADILRDASAAYWQTRRYDPDPRGTLRAREAIAQYYARRQPPLEMSPDRIFVTASTSEAYALLFTLLAGPGDNVLAPIPSYPLFSHLAAMHHVTLRTYPLEYLPVSRGMDGLDAPQAGALAAMPPVQWQLHPARLQSRRDERTRALLLVSPHNPTGHVLQEPAPELASLHVPVIADEVFCEFPFAARAVPAVGTLCPDATVFHLNGISKMFALPDLKLGWIALSGPNVDEYVDRLELLNDTLLGANSMTQYMLPILFERGTAFVQAMRDRIQSSLLAALSHLQPIDRIRVAPPLAGMYLFPEVVDCYDEDLLLEEMLAAGLFAHPGYFYDEDRGCFLMISALLEPPRLADGLSRLKHVLDVA